MIRTAIAMGYSTVAVASEADRDARHVRLADEAIIIGPASVALSYLDSDRLIDAARRSGADAIHPGYGFLSENADFAQACIDSGLTFVGPSPDAIRAMGDKAESKRRMIAEGLPCIPGYEGADQDDGTLREKAAEIGFPLMVKASAGGGGRGMRLAESMDALPGALAAARSEAMSAFGDDTLLLERAIVDARHIEVQVFGDMHGAVVHLGERDCSVQRRHQKVIEEAPSPSVGPGLREMMGAAAVKAARSIDYVGAGTVEFLLDGTGAFYFLEMNTRLQVEHPVTEFVTGLDLVALQLKVAVGEPISVRQEGVSFQGHAIEVRLYAEDPTNDFLPQTGQIGVWRPAAGLGIRVDHGIDRGALVTSHYDAMIAKLIAHGSDRTEALRRLTRAIEGTTLLGVRTNKGFLLQALEAPEFVRGEATTSFIALQTRNGRFDQPELTNQERAFGAALIAELSSDVSGRGWRSNAWAAHTIHLMIDEEVVNLRARRDALDWIIDGLGNPVRIAFLELTEDKVRWTSEGHIRTSHYLARGSELHIDFGRAVHVLHDATYAPSELAVAADGEMRAPMNGMVAAVHVGPGDSVMRGQPLVVLEAMKMEHQILAPDDGVVETVPAVVGARVGARAVLVTLHPRTAGEA